MALSDIVKSVSKEYLDTEGRILNIIEFAESPSGLNMKLYPMQKLILKIFYRIPLSSDINENTITIRDTVNDQILHKFCERDCLDYLFSQKMINVSYYDIYIANIPLNKIDFYIGRRGTKTKMFTIITCYSMYELLSQYDPHGNFNHKPVTDEISATLVSNKLAGAKRQFREVTGAIAKSKFFKPFIVGKFGTDFWLKTRAFIDLQEQGLAINEGNIRISCAAANYGVRGDANVLGGLDEFCHYLDSENNDKKEKPLDEAMYEALAPSTFEYRGLDGKMYGKMFILSSPNGKKGEGYKRYNRSFEDKGYLMLNMPSHYVNPAIDKDELKAMQRANPASYEQEILGKFNAKVSKWISNSNIVLASSNRNHPNTPGFGYNKAYTYYMGIDFALDGDGTAVAIAHTEPTLPNNYEPIDDKYKGMLAAQGDYYILDYIYLIQPAKGKTLDITYLVKKIYDLVRLYNIRAGAYDQWSKGTIEKELKKYGLGNVLTCLTATMQSNNDLAKTYKQVVLEGRLVTPNDADTYPEYSEDWSMTYLDEVFQLIEYKKREGYIKVENPGGHDDRYKAAEKAIYLAYTKAAPSVESVHQGLSSYVTSGGVSYSGSAMQDLSRLRKLSSRFDLNKRIG